MSDPFDLADDAAAAPLEPPQPAVMANPRYLEGLNESQRQAVETVDGPVLVLAGAGTGKTRVLTTRLAHILITGRARPWEILAVTFTNKAAREMKVRVSTLLGRPLEGWWIGTFHSIGARIVRAHAEVVGLRSNFTILDEDDQVRLIKQLTAAARVDEKRWPPRMLAGVIQRWKDKGLTPDKVPTAEAEDVAEGKLLGLYQEYQERLKVLNAADFGDLLLHCLTIFQTEPEILKRYQNQFKYLLVDEYQDTNVAQYLWLRLLAQGRRNVCCVGDDDQSIYSWRGAEVGNILRFETDFPGAKIVRLEKNYRSTPHILAAASGLIAHNEGRLGKTLWTDVSEGERIRVTGVWDGEEEARVVADEIEALHAKRHSLNEMAILVRAGFQTREFEERLMTLAIPYRVIGGPRFYERAEIRDAMAYLRVVAQPDDDLAFERIVNVPKRGLGPATLQMIHVFARARGISLTESVRKLVDTDEMKPKARKTLADLIEDFARWRSLLPGIHHAELAAQILDESGYMAMWKADTSPDAPGRIDNLKEFVSALEEFDSLAAFLEHVSLVMEIEESQSDEKVTIMTLHGAKGLEFDTVFLPGWEEGVFPNQRALDDGGLKSLEEERRLAYVGITRARHRALISFAANRRVYNQWQSAIPSRFIDELPGDHVTHAAERGLYGGTAGRGMAEDVHAFQSGRWQSPRLRHQQRSEAMKPRDERRNEGDLSPGQRVFHQKFGYGHIVAIDGDKLEIAFDKAGIKKVIESFIESV